MFDTIEKEHIINIIRKFYETNDNYQTIQTTLVALGAEVLDCSEDAFIKLMNDIDDKSEKFVIDCEYGTVNPTVFTLYKVQNNYWTQIDMYCHDAKKAGYQKTDEEQYEALEQLANGRKIDKITINPACASFIETIRRHKKYKIVCR